MKLIRRQNADLWNSSPVEQSSTLREEIEVSLDPSLSPTEWRRAGVSLVATLVSEPEGSLRAIKQLLDGPVSAADPGLAA